MSKGLGVTLALAIFSAYANAQAGLTIKEILVRGNSNITEAAIRAAMRTEVGRPFVESELQRDQQSLLNLGVFADVKVFSRELSETEVQIIVDVQENPLVKEISIMGNSVVSTEEIMKVVTQQKDQVLNFNSRRPTAEAIRNLYEKKGFFAEVDFPAMPDAPQTMVILVIETKVNRIEITGLTRTKKRVIDRLIKTRPGDALSERTWGSDVRRVASTQWFEDIKPGIKPAEELGTVDLFLDLKETRTARFDIGAALDPRSRLAGTLAISDSNFRGQGQALQIRWQQDTFGSGASVSASFVNPFFDKHDTTMAIDVFSRINSYFTSFGGSNSSIDTDSRFDERRTGGNLTFTRPTKSMDITTGLSLESVDAVNLTLSSADFIQQDGTLLKFLIAAQKDRRDVPLDPFEGDYWRVAIEPGFSNIKKIGGNVASFTDILGNNTYVKSTVEYKAFFSKRPTDRTKIGAPRPVLATRAKFGTISGVVPFYEQFFIGGSDSVRGYQEQRFWGKSQFLISAEYRYPVPGADTFNLIGFADYGGAWGGYDSISNFTQSDKVQLNFGYGLGVGFRTPLGAIRIDFGFTPKGSTRTHFTIGGSF